MVESGREKYTCSKVQTGVLLSVKRLDGPKPCGVDDQHLAGLDLANVLGVDQVKGTRLRRHAPRVVQFAQHQRAKAARVANRNQATRASETAAKTLLRSL